MAGVCCKVARLQGFGNRFGRLGLRALLHLLLIRPLLMLPGYKELAIFSLQIAAAEMRALRIWISC